MLRYQRRIHSSLQCPVTLAQNASLAYCRRHRAVKAEQNQGIVPLLAIPPPSAVFVVPGVGLG